MIGDLDKKRLLASTPGITKFLRPSINVKGIPLKIDDLPTTNPDVMYFNFDFFLTWCPTARVTKKGKDFVIGGGETRLSFRFETIEELHEKAKSSGILAFALKWGRPITEEILAFLRKTTLVKVSLFGAEEVMAYDKHLRECWKEEYGEYPPPEKNMFGPEFSIKAREEIALMRSKEKIDSGERAAFLWNQRKRNLAKNDNIRVYQEKDIQWEQGNTGRKQRPGQTDVHKQ